jgi:methylamine dehydrogenase accessory protein MauD
MNASVLASNMVLWAVVLFLGFLTLGALRALALLSWRLEQLEAITPSRIGRDGINLGKKAPDFTLPRVTGGEASLRDFAGRKVLLVLTQSGCGPCHAIVPELNRLHDRGQPPVVVVNNGGTDATRRWAAEARARFPVLAQMQFSLSKRYQVFATPFAFLIDERGIIRSKGLVGSRQHLTYVLTGAGQRAKQTSGESESDGGEQGQTPGSVSSKEVTHV